MFGLNWWSGEHGLEILIWMVLLASYKFVHVVFERLYDMVERSEYSILRIFKRHCIVVRYKWQYCAAAGSSIVAPTSRPAASAEVLNTSITEGILP